VVVSVDTRKLAKLIRHCNNQLLVPVAEVIVPRAGESVDTRSLRATSDSSHGCRGVIQKNVEFISSVSIESREVSNVLILGIKSSGQQIGLDILSREICSGLGGRSAGSGSRSAGDSISGVSLVTFRKLEEIRDHASIQGDRVSGVLVQELHDVGAVRSTASFTCVTSLSVTSRITIVMSVGSRPLEGKAFSDLDSLGLGPEIVFDGREGLDDVSSLALDVDVPDFRGHFRGSSLGLGIARVQA